MLRNWIWAISKPEGESVATASEMRDRVPVWFRHWEGTKAPGEPNLVSNQGNCYRSEGKSFPNGDVTALKGKVSCQSEDKECHKVILKRNLLWESYWRDTREWLPLPKQETAENRARSRLYIKFLGEKSFLGWRFLRWGISEISSKAKW